MLTNKSRNRSTSRTREKEEKQKPTQHTPTKTKNKSRNIESMETEMDSAPNTENMKIKYTPNPRHTLHKQLWPNTKIPTR